jgi:hypothetical protein
VDLCDAWLNFHLNVHKGVPGTQAFTIDSTGEHLSDALLDRGRGPLPILGCSPPKKKSDSRRN